MKPYAVKYTTINRKGELETKTKEFATEKAYAKGLEKIEAANNFYRFDAYSEPRKQGGA